MKSKMFLLIIFLNIFSYVFNLNKRFFRLESKLFDGLDVNIMDGQSDHHKKSTDKELDILLNIYDFMNREHINFRKEYYSVMFRKISELNKSKGQGGNIIDLYLLPDELIDSREYYIRSEKINRLIRKEINSHDTIHIMEKTQFYANLTRIRSIDRLFIGFKRGYTPEIKSLVEAWKFVTFDPPQLILREKPMCIPAITLIKLKNLEEENLILNHVFSDKYQVSIFLLDPSKQSYNINQKNQFPKMISSGETVLFQVIVLPDTTETINGNIIFNFDKKGFILYPIEIHTKNNIYNAKPVYHPDWHGSTLLKVPIELYNPHDKPLIIKELSNSFYSVKTEWANGQLISPNKTTLTYSMIEIPPKETVTLLHLNFYKEFEGIDYGLLQIKTDKDILIIPVLVSIELPALSLYPSYLDFGVIDLNVKVDKVIPIRISNRNNVPVQINAIYSSYDSFIEFIPNYDYDHFFNLEESQGNRSEGNSCVIKPGEEITNFGYFILNVENIKKNSTSLTFDEYYKSGSVMIRTNFTVNPIIEIEYSYLITENIFSYYINNKEVKLDRNNHVELDYDLIKKNLTNFDIYAVFNKKDTIFKPSFSDSFYNEVSNQNDIKLIKENSNMKNFDSFDIGKEQSIVSFIDLVNTKNSIYFAEQLNIFLAIVNPNNLKKFYHIPFKTSFDNKYGLIPIKLISKSLDFVYCDNHNTYEDCKIESFHKKVNTIHNVNKKNSFFLTDYEILPTTYFEKKYFALVNENDEDIWIEGIDVFSPKIIFELCRIGPNSKKPNPGEIIRHQKDLCYNRAARTDIRYDKYSCKIPANTFYFFSLRLYSKTEGKINENAKIHFSNKMKLTILMKGEFKYGELSVPYPHLVFEPGYPGKIQNFTSKVFSTFKVPVIIESIKINDKRIIPTIIGNPTVLHNEKKEMFRVTFDPAKQTNYKYFLADPTIIDYSNKVVSYKDYFMWRENEKLWDIMKYNNQTKMYLFFRLKTNVLDYDDIYKISASIEKPKLSSEKEINFGIIKVGDVGTKYFEINNPSEDFVSVQFFMAGEELLDLNNDDVFVKNNLNIRNGIVQLFGMDCYSVNYSDEGQLILHDYSNINKIKNVKAINTEDFGNKLPLLIELKEEHSITDGLNLNLNKSQLINAVYSNSPAEANEYLSSSDKLVCDHKIMKRIEFLNTFKNLNDRILPDDYKKEIEAIRNMTQEQFKPITQKKEKPKEKSLMYQILSTINSFFIKKKETIHENKSKLSIQPLQQFYLPRNITSNIYTLKPKQKLKLGPVIFNPKSNSISTATLLMKNNLTILSPIKLTGIGGLGNLSFFEHTEESQSLIKIYDNFLKIDYDLHDTANELPVKILTVANTGNMQIEIEKIEFEDGNCESSWIKLDKCSGIVLSPNDQYNLNIYVNPDFSMSFLKKEIRFITEHRVYTCNILIEVNQKLLALKNQVLNFNIFELWGYLTFPFIGLIFILLFNIVNIICVEYRNCYKSVNKHQHSKLIYISYKDVIENNPDIKFENLFIKSFRKSDEKLGDDMNVQSVEKNPKESEDKIREKEYVNLEKENEYAVGAGNNHLDAQESQAKIINENANKNIKQSFKPEIQNENNDLIQIKPVNIKKSNKVNKKPTSHNLIGMGSKVNEKEIKEDIERKKKNSLTKENSTYNNQKHDKYSNKNLNDNQQNAIRENREDYTHQKYDKKKNRNSYYEADNYRPKSPMKNKKESINLNFKKTNSKDNLNQIKPNQVAQINIRAIQKENIKEEITEIPKKNLTIIESEPALQENLHVEGKATTATLDTKLPEIEELNNTIIADVTEKSFDEIVTEEIIHINIGQKEGEEPLLINPTLNQQFLSFDPLFIFNKQEQPPKSDRSNMNNKSKNNTVRHEEEIATDLIRQDILQSEEKAHSLKNEKEHNIHVTKPLIHNEQTNNFLLFNNFENFESIKPLNIKENFNFEKDSDLDEKIMYEEDDLTSHNYQSEKEKFDSGTEEFRFNFNSIFTGHNVKMMDHTNYKEDTTDNEDIQSGNKPYFDKNLLFPSIDLTKSQSGLFSSNPFAPNSSRKLLDELREENYEEDYEDNHDKYEGRVYDDLKNDEDDEEDPEWADEIIDNKEIGYFDETGTYKLRYNFR